MLKTFRKREVFFFVLEPISIWVLQIATKLVIFEQRSAYEVFLHSPLFASAFSV